MKPGFGARLKSSRITRESLTWSNGSLGKLVDVANDATAYSNQTSLGRATNTGGSWQDRIVLSAGMTGEWFKQPYEQPPTMLDDDTSSFRNGIGGWTALGTSAETGIPTWDVDPAATQKGRILTITMGQALPFRSGSGIVINGLDVGSTYTVVADVSCAAASTAPAWNVNGTSGSGTSSCTPTYPTLATGDLLTLRVVSKYAYCDDPAGWVLLARISGGAGASGAASGVVYTSLYGRSAIGSESGTFTVQTQNGNSIQAGVTKITGAGIDTAYYVGADNSGTSPYTASIPVPAGSIVSGDKILVYTGVNDAAPTVTTRSLTIPGCTVTFTAQRAGTGQFNGDDTASYIHEFAVTAGSSTGADATFSITFSSGAPAGASIMQRYRTDPQAVLSVDSSLITSQGQTTALNTYQTLTTTFVATKPQHVIGVVNTATTNGDLNYCDSIHIYDGPDSSSPPLLAFAGDPIQRGYSALVAPQKFWQRGDNPTHVYSSSGMTSGFTFTPTRNTHRRLDDAYAGLYYLDDSGLHHTNTDAISPRAQRQAIASPALPYKQGGSAFHGTTYNLPWNQGSVFRQSRMSNPTASLPVYFSGYFKTTRNVWNFLGGYIDYVVAYIQYGAVDTVDVRFVNDTDTIGGTVGYLAIAYNHSGSTVGRVKCTDVVVNDGQWHHWFLLIDANGRASLYIDGVFAVTNNNGDLVNANISANQVTGGTNALSGFEGDQGFYGFGDATNVTFDRIKYLASMRTLPDHALAQVNANTFVDVGQNTFTYINEGVRFVNSVVSTNPNNNTNTSLAVSLASTAPGIVNYIHFNLTGSTSSVDPAPITPAGWTLIAYNWNGSTPPCGTAIYAKAYALGDPAAVTIRWTNNPSQAHAITNAYFGVDTAVLARGGNVANQSVSSSSKQTASIPLNEGAWLAYGFSDRTGTSDYVLGQTDTSVRNLHRNSSSINMISADTNHIIVPQPQTTIAYTATGPVTSVGQNWWYWIPAANDAKWIRTANKAFGYDGSLWSPDPKVYDATTSQWKRAD